MACARDNDDATLDGGSGGPTVEYAQGVAGSMVVRSWRTGGPVPWFNRFPVETGKLDRCRGWSGRAAGGHLLVGQRSEVPPLRVKSTVAWNDPREECRLVHVGLGCAYLSTVRLSEIRSLRGYGRTVIGLALLPNACLGGRSSRRLRCRHGASVDRSRGMRISYCGIGCGPTARSVIWPTKAKSTGPAHLTPCSRNHARQRAHASFASAARKLGR